MNYYIKQGNINDLSVIQSLAKQTFDETFRAQNKPEHINHYLKTAFTDEKITQEINHMHTVFYILYVDNMPAGYLKLNERDAQTEVKDESYLEIERIYLLNDFQSKGLGSALYNKALEIAKYKNKQKIWLGVWEKNVQAIAFYKHKGFVQTDIHHFMMGDDAQTDYIMEKDITEPKSRALPVILTNMCMIEDGSKILVQDRQGKSWPGITFPGGHIELGESFHDSVIREVKEETGLDIQQPKLCGLKQFFTSKNERYIVLFYKTNHFKGDIQASEEGNVYWIEKADLKKQQLANDFIEMYEVFESDQLSEFFYEQDNDDWIIKLY